MCLAKKLYIKKNGSVWYHGLLQETELGILLADTGTQNWFKFMTYEEQGNKRSDGTDLGWYTVGILIFHVVFETVD